MGETVRDFLNISHKWSLKVSTINIFLKLGNYKLQLYDPRTNGFAPSSPEIGMHVEIRDPEDKIILSKVYSSEGRWTFTSHTPGEHVICLYTNSSKWFSGTQLVSTKKSKFTRKYCPTYVRAIKIWIIVHISIYF